MIKELIKRIVNRLFWLYNGTEYISDSIDKEEVDGLFAVITQDDVAKRFFKNLIKQDKERYFLASDDIQRATIKGQIIRSMSILRKISKYDEDKDGVKRKIGGRYRL